MPGAIPSISQVIGGTANSQIALFIEVDFEGLERSNKHPLSDVELLIVEQAKLFSSEDPGPLYIFLDDPRFALKGGVHDLAQLVADDNALTSEDE